MTGGFATVRNRLPPLRRPRSRVLALATVPLLAGLCLLLGISVARADRDLSSVEREVARDYDRIAHLPAASVAERLGKAADGTAVDGPVLFDVRSDAEFAVSHLPGAIRVDPDLSARAFLDRYGAEIAGRQAVFYCSVGVRSSKLTTRVAQALPEAQRSGIANLEGGIFRWSLNRAPLVNAAGPTTEVHAYDRFWGRLLETD